MNKELQARLINWGRWKRATDSNTISRLTGQIKTNTLHHLMVKGGGKRYKYASSNSASSIDYDDAKLLNQSLNKINALTHSLRKILEVYYASNLSQRDLAKAIKINQSTFCRRLKKAKHIVENNI